MKKLLKSILFVAVCLSPLLLPLSCRKDAEKPDPGDCELGNVTAANTYGYGILEHLPGIWNGPLTSPTPLGSFPEWIVDFRPISGSHVSAKNELDSINDIFMSFFVVKHDCEYKMGFRNGGGFAGSERISYMIIDSVSEGSSEDFYRFADVQAGKHRVYTDMTFKGDSLIMHTYTNQYNSLSEPVTHFIWRADLRDTSSTQAAITQHSFTTPELVRDFSTAFNGLSEAIYFSPNGGPLPDTANPYLGEADITVNVVNPVSPDPTRQVMVIISTQPLLPGMVYNPANLDYRSRYIVFGANTTLNYLFDYMHPGDYYLNAVYDADGDGTIGSGDYMNSSFDSPFTVPVEGQVSSTVTIDFQIP